jgi:hypothetical protein
LTNESESRLWAKCSKDKASQRQTIRLQPLSTTFTPLHHKIPKTNGLTTEYTIAGYATILLVALDYSFYLVVSVEALWVYNIHQRGVIPAARTIWSSKAALAEGFSLTKGPIRNQVKSHVLTRD